MNKKHALGIILPIIGSIVMILITCWALYLQTVKYALRGLLATGEYNNFQLILISWGIVMPFLAIEMTVLAAFIWKKSEYVSLFLGPILITLVIMLDFVLINQILNWIRWIPILDPVTIPYNFILIILNEVSIGVQSIVLVGGISCIAYFITEKK